MQVGEHVHVALDQRALRDDVHRVLVVATDLEAAAREPEARFDRLVAIGDAAENQQLTLPAALLERCSQELGSPRLDHQAALVKKASDDLAFTVIHSPANGRVVTPRVKERVGQEVIVRVLHRGGGRIAKRLVRLAACDEGAALAAWLR